MEKILVLGAMPEGADPRVCLAAGPWCFAGREEIFPDWENRFVFAPEPLRDPACLEHCAQQALVIYAEALPALAETLCPANNLPPAYWETLLAPWGVDVARQIAERRMRVAAMIELWGGLPLRVPLLPEECSFSFATGHDFTLYGALGTAFNHWLLSRLLEAAWPGAWRKEILPPVSERRGIDNRPRGVKERLRQGARRLVLGLPCPPLKGMSLLQSLRFSLALLHKSRGKDHSFPPGAIFEGARPQCDPPLPALPVFLAALPRGLRELRHPVKLRVTAAPRLRVASILSYEDEKYLQRLAVWRGRGHRLMYAQHGAGYGQIRAGCMAPAVEYCQHAFVTWGWREHGGLRGNFIPLPYPQLARIAEQHRAGGEDILFVGTEMPLFPYRLDGWPTPLRVLEYRQAKRRFFTALRDDLRGRSLYRPYFPVPGTLRDADWLLPQFPQVRLCAGNLAGRMLSCRLLVLDHPGTTMLEALVANVPTVSYWSRHFWSFTRESEIMLDGLAEAGIWYPTPEDAARAVGRVFDNPSRWWKSDAVQSARRRYCAKYALTVRGSENQYWIRTLARL
ncbi:MAG: LIC12162 family protein [Desulfovibrio sp.]|jgi:putative transferase (TIGR04331 family)|nr:LIC12162 family protein [Desulfovibrio sp.]